MAIRETNENGDYVTSQDVNFYPLTLSNNDWIHYQFNNWFHDLYIFTLPQFNDMNDCATKSPNVTNTQVNLCKINQKGAAIWISTTGNIQYRLTIDGEIKTATSKKISTILSAYCGEFFNIIKEKSIPRKRDGTISIYDLMIVEGRKFDPYQSKEFFSLQEAKEKALGFSNIQHNRNIFYINGFKPSYYHCLNVNQENNNEVNTKSSIILQYIYYLANYKHSRFEYILGWIASFFQDFKNKSKTALILIGNEASGIELLFKNVIAPLFGEHNTIKISDHNLNIKNQYLLIENKLFYNLHNLSVTTMENKKNISFIDTILLDDVIKIEVNQQKIVDLSLYGQTLITSEKEVSYISTSKHHKYKVFKVPNDINNIYLNDDLKTKKQNSTLVDMFSNDLKNFSMILRLFSLTSDEYIKDDRDEFNISLDDILSKFDRILMYGKYQELEKIELDEASFLLYKELKKDFEKKQIKQKNIFKFFMLLYPNTEIKSPRTLMKKLRKIKPNFYARKELKNGEHGLKYFNIY